MLTPENDDKNRKLSDEEKATIEKVFKEEFGKYFSSSERTPQQESDDDELSNDEEVEGDTNERRKYIKKLFRKYIGTPDDGTL